MPPAKDMIEQVVEGKDPISVISEAKKFSYKFQGQVTIEHDGSMSSADLIKIAKRVVEGVKQESRNSMVVDDMDLPDSIEEIGWNLK